MKLDLIEQALKNADAQVSATRQVSAATLAGAVLDARRRGRRRRTMGRVAAVILLAGATSVWMLRSPSHRQREMVQLPQSSPADLAHEIENTERNLRRMLAAERLAQAEMRLAELSESPTPMDVTERAAHALVAQADRLARTDGLVASAERAYIEVITHLPETASAKVARQRIAELRKEG